MFCYLVGLACFEIFPSLYACVVTGYLVSFQSKLQKTTMLKKILQDSKESVGESDIRSKMNNLKEQLTNTVNHLHSVCETHVFIALSRGYWDRMGQVTIFNGLSSPDILFCVVGELIILVCVIDCFKLFGEQEREQSLVQGF